MPSSAPAATSSATCCLMASVEYAMRINHAALSSRNKRGAPVERSTSSTRTAVKIATATCIDGHALLASSIRHLSDASIVSIYFNKEQSFAELQQLKGVLSGWRGDDPVMLNFPAGAQNQTIIVGNQFWVKASDELKNVIDNVLANRAKVLLNRVRM